MRRVLVAGPRDAGKSTYCHVLLRAALDAGRSVALVDTDLGQKMVGPPACVTLGRAAPDAGLALSELAFVGTTDPVRGWRDVVSGAARLAAEAGAELLVINTGGLLAGPGRRLKADKVEALSPELVIGVGQDPGLDAVLSGRAGLPVIRLDSSPLARRKAFRAYFASATEVWMSLASLRVERVPASLAYPPARLLIGLADASRRDSGIGIVTAIDTDAGTFACLTPSNVESVSWMRWGTFMLNDDFSEMPMAGPRGPGG
jgi:polynucleotide 5'-hydroxyl-kinase GRC3/NOL9